MKRILFLLFLIPFFGFSQVPAGYYDGTTGLMGYALKSKLHDIISSKNINWHYGDLQEFYKQTDLDVYYDHTPTNNPIFNPATNVMDYILLDIYSEKPAGPDAYEYTTNNSTGSANAEGLGWNREHMMPQSSFNSNYPMYSDLFYVVPTDARINQLRSNYPYGISSTTPSLVYYNFTNTSKIGKNATPNSGYTGRVYEPIDEFKGDVARSLLYFAVRYEGKLNSFNFYNGTSAANDTSPLDGTEEKSFEDWYVAMLLNWHNQDPVSQREIDRNNAVYNIQKNRNPFIDHPEWVNLIWNQTPSVVAPTQIIDLGVAQNSAYFVNLNWTASADPSVLGYKIYQNGNLIGSSKTNTFFADRLTPSTSYNFTVKAYNNNYMESVESNLVSVTTLDSDVYAKDLMITKYLEGTSNNKAIEITNKTGHPVNLNRYRMSIQFYNGTQYYFPAPYELEGVVQNNETFVILNPNAAFSCINNSQAKFVTAAPQLTFTGSNYVELRYNSTTVDAVGTKDQSNFSVLGNVSLYRLNSVTQPTSTFDLAEWQNYPTNYCQNLGTLSVSNVTAYAENDIQVYPNPAVGNKLYLKGKQINKTQEISIFDFSGKLIQKTKQSDDNTVDIQKLPVGNYILQIDGKSVKFIRK